MPSALDTRHTGELAPEKIETLARRVQAEFHEMPGLRLTEAQARCLFGLPPGDCLAVLDALCARRYLARFADGRYGRVSANAPA